MTLESILRNRKSEKVRFSPGEFPMHGLGEFRFSGSYSNSLLLLVVYLGRFAKKVFLKLWRCIASERVIVLVWCNFRWHDENTRTYPIPMDVKHVYLRWSASKCELIQLEARFQLTYFYCACWLIVTMTINRPSITTKTETPSPDTFNLRFCLDIL